MTRVSKVPFFSLLVIVLLLPVASSAQEDEEVVKVEDLKNLDDPLKKRLLDVVRQQTPELV